MYAPQYYFLIWLLYSTWQIYDWKAAFEVGYYQIYSCKSHRNPISNIILFVLLCVALLCFWKSIKPCSKGLFWISDFRESTFLFWKNIDALAAEQLSITLLAGWSSWRRALWNLSLQWIHFCKYVCTLSSLMGFHIFLASRQWSW